jgi:DNA-binding Lrp family transcriptional regulator
MYADGLVRVVTLIDPRRSRATSWLVRIQCRPDAATSLAEALAGREDVSWVTLTAGGSEVTCAIRGNPLREENELLLQRLPRTSQVLSFTAHAVLHRFVAGGADWTAYTKPFTRAQIKVLRGPTAAEPRTDTAVRADDAPLLDQLAVDGRATYAELARATGWSQSRVAARLEELLSSEAVYVDTEISADLLGFTASAYLWLTVAPDQVSRVGEALSELPQVAFVAAVTGEASLLAAATCRDTEELYQLMTAGVGRIGEVQRLDVAPVIRRIKQAGSLMDGIRLTSRAAPPRRR